MAVLRKRDVERMLDTYDDDPVGALTAALRVVLDAPGLDWNALVEAADLDATRRTHLLAGDPGALDGLARELNETRTLRDAR